jgi:hypothetical protein
MGGVKATWAGAEFWAVAGMSDKARAARESEAKMRMEIPFGNDFRGNLIAAIVDSAMRSVRHWFGAIS